MKMIKATMVEGQWVVELESDAGKPITPKEFTLFARALKIKLRTYYIAERQASLQRVRLAEGAKEVTKVSDAKGLQVVEKKGTTDGKR